MKTIILTCLFTGFLLSAGCASLGTTYLSDGWITVSIGPNVKSDKKKETHLRKSEGVETLHRYIAHRFRKLKVRKTLKFDVVINDYRVGWGRDHMGVDVVVTEDGKELMKFTELETTGRSSVIEKLSKGLARRMYDKIKDL